MRRRAFVKSGVATAALGALPFTGSPADDDRRFYELRLYQTRSDMAPDRLTAFLEHTLTPALMRAGAGTVGAFWPDVGLNNQQIVLLVEHRSAADAVTLSQKLEADGAYASAVAALDGDAHPAYVHYEARLMRAFANHPRIEVPAPASQGGRLFELRTYESRDATTLARKIAMFNESEIALFRSLNMTPVFFAEDIYGAGLPSLTYMLAFDDMTAREKAWRAFGSSPEWQRLTKDPKFTVEGITTTTRAMFLRPLSFSQIR